MMDSTNSHTVRAYGDELNQITADIARMGGLAEAQIADAVWGSDVYVEARTVDVHVGRLRKALMQDVDTDPIRTVRSAGYSLDLDG